MHYAAHKQTAAEVIHARVDSEKPMVGMSNFKGNYITKSDVSIAKNYLTERALTILNLLVSRQQAIEKLNRNLNDIGQGKCVRWKVILTER